MFKKLLKVLFRIFKIAFLLTIAVILLPRVITTIYAQNKITTVSEAQQEQTAIIYGAGLRRDGEPAAVLRDRIRTGVELYQAGKVETLLMSGHAPEPEAMREYAIEQGVPPEDILLDEGGLRTYDTCYQAVNVFGLSSATLVTQPFHMPRALYLCSMMGMEVQGVEAYQGRYWRGAMTFWQIRETLATVVALWEVHISKPEPTVMQAAINTEG